MIMPDFFPYYTLCCSVPSFFRGHTFLLFFKVFVICILTYFGHNFSASKSSENEKIEELREGSKEQDEQDGESSKPSSLEKPVGEDNNITAETSLPEESSSTLESVKTDNPKVTSEEKIESLINDREDVPQQEKEAASEVQESIRTEDVVSDKKVEPLGPKPPEMPGEVVNGDITGEESESTIEETQTKTSEKEEEEEEVDEDELPPLVSYYDEVD